MDNLIQPGQKYGYSELSRDIKLLKEKYSCVKVDSPAGYSALGRDLIVIRLGTGQRHVHYNASHHGNEWITSLLIMKFVEEYARAYHNSSELTGFNVGQIYQEATIWLIPMVNPDGVDIVQNGVSREHPAYEELLQWNGGAADFSGWKANSRGVDLNRQYRAGWELARKQGPSGPAPAGYAGPEPESEPESAAVANFTRRRSFDLVLAFHSQGRVVYWNYQGLAPQRSRQIATDLYRLSGYIPVSEAPTGASHGGYKDWFIKVFRRPGFTVEVGKGTNPLPISQFPIIWENSLPILLHAATVS